MGELWAYLRLLGENWPQVSATGETNHIERTAFQLFWFYYYIPDPSHLDMLDELTKAWQPKYAPDSEADWTQMYVYLHLGAALAVVLHENEGLSEALISLTEKLAQCAMRLQATSSLLPVPITYEEAPEYFNDDVPIRRSLPIVCSLIFALLFYIRKAQGAWEQAFDCCDAAFQATDTAFGHHRFNSDAEGAIEFEYVPVIMVSKWIHPQDVVEVFENLYKSSAGPVDWSRLAGQCEELNNCYEVAMDEDDSPPFYVKSSLATVQTQGGPAFVPLYSLGQFLSFAQGLCMQRLSPDAYRRLREDDEKDAAKKRLQRYFFWETWDRLPVEAREHLISADRLYWDREGSYDSILNHLRLACETYLEVAIWTPWSQWAETIVLKDLRALAAHESAMTASGTRLGQFLNQMFRSSAFSNYVHANYGPNAQFLARDLPEALQRLLELRNRAEHPSKDQPRPSRQEVASIYEQFIGIGNAGVLTYLAKVLSGS